MAKIEEKMLQMVVDMAAPRWQVPVPCHLYLPSPSEQRRIVARLDSLSENVRKYEEIQKKIIAECDSLKQAMLRQVFE